MYASSRTFEVISIRASKNFRRILLVQTEVKHDHCWPPFLVNCQKSWVITLRLQWISTNRRDRDQIGQNNNIARLSFIILYSTFCEDISLRRFVAKSCVIVNLNIPIIFILNSQLRRVPILQENQNKNFEICQNEGRKGNCRRVIRY